MPDITTLGLFAQYLLGLYFIGCSISIKRTNRITTFSYDFFEFVFGAVLLGLALWGTVL